MLILAATCAQVVVILCNLHVLEEINTKSSAYGL